MCIVGVCVHVCALPSRPAPQNDKLELRTMKRDILLINSFCYHWFPENFQGSARMSAQI